MVTEALEFIWNEGLAVLWSTTNGTGVITGLKPQAAEAFTFTVFMEEAILVK